MEQQTIKGSDLLKRWGAMPFKLADAIRAGLVPIDTSLGNRRTPDVDPCLVCQGRVALRTCTGCQRETIERIVDGKQFVTVNRHCQLMDKDGRFETGFREYIGQAEFILSEVEAYEKVHGIAATTQPTTATTEPGQDQQVEAVPHFATASDLVAYYRGREVDGRKIHELHELARLVDEEFTRKARLTDEELGMLLPAKEKEAESPEGCRSQGKRLRSLYKKSQ